MTRSGEGRGATSSGFSRASRAAALEGRGASVSLRDANAILKTSDQVATKVKSHHAKHREAWTTKRYGDLLAKKGETLEFAPAGMGTDPKVILKAKAGAEVAQSFSSRMARVERARDSLLQSGKLRETRSVDWGKGLGE